jgi:Spy/CpxP family protein refolding chaperone
MKRTTILIVAAVLVLAVWAAAQGRQPGPPPGPGMPGMPGRPGMMGPGMRPMGPPPSPCALNAVNAGMPMLFMFGDQINLSKTQQSKLMQMDRKSMMPLMKKATDATEKLRTAMLAKNFDDKKVQQLSAESSKAEAALVQNSIQTWKNVRKILTAKQLKKLAELAKNPPMPFGMGGMRPMGPGGPGGPPPGGPMGPGGRGPGGR